MGRSGDTTEYTRICTGNSGIDTDNPVKKEILKILDEFGEDHRAALQSLAIEALE